MQIVKIHLEKPNTTSDLRRTVRSNGVLECTVSRETFGLYGDAFITLSTDYVCPLDGFTVSCIIDMSIDEALSLYNDLLVAVDSVKQSRSKGREQ